MKALLLETADGPEAVRVAEVDTPEAKAGEVRVAIKAASMNHREMWISRGLYPGMVLPSTMGCDGAGVVDQIGDGVSGVSIGDEVVMYPGRDWGPSRHAPQVEFGLLGMPHPGTIAEYVCVPAENIAAKPKNMSWEEAAATLLTGLTAWRALMFKGQLQPGETVLISGVGGGVATFGLAFAVAFGAKVYVTGESEEVIAQAKEMGAIDGVLFTDPEWRKKIGPMTGGIDLVIDGAPGPSYRNYIRSINPGARIVIYGSTAGDKFEVAATGLFLKSASLVGSQVGDPQDFRDMLAFIDEHNIRPVIEKTFSLDDADKALTYLENEHHFGKVVITV